jgi:hypothetical protein
MLDFREHVYDLHWAEDYPHHPKGGVWIGRNEELYKSILNIINVSEP